MSHQRKLPSPYRIGRPRCSSTGASRCGPLTATTSAPRSIAAWAHERRKAGGSCGSRVALVRMRRRDHHVGMLRGQPDRVEVGRQRLVVGIVAHPHRLAQLEAAPVQLQRLRRFAVGIDVLREPRHVAFRDAPRGSPRAPASPRGSRSPSCARAPRAHPGAPAPRRTRRVRSASPLAGLVVIETSPSRPASVSRYRGASGGSQRRSRPGVHERRFLEPEAGLDQAPGAPVRGVVVRPAEHVEAERTEVEGGIRLRPHGPVVGQARRDRLGVGEIDDRRLEVPERRVRPSEQRDHLGERPIGRRRTAATAG